MSRGIVTPGRIRPKFAPKEVRLPGLFIFAVAAFSQLHENRFVPVNNSFRGETSVGGVSAVEYQ